MDPTRFDALSRAFSSAASRRGVIAALAALAGVAARPAVGPAQATSTTCPSCGACTTCQPDGSCAEGCASQCLAATLCAQATGNRTFKTLAGRLAADGFGPVGEPGAATLTGGDAASVFWTRFAHSARTAEEAWLLYRVPAGGKPEVAALVTVGGVPIHTLIVARRKVRRILPAPAGAAALGRRAAGRQGGVASCACDFKCRVVGAIGCAAVGLVCDLAKTPLTKFGCGVLVANLACGASFDALKCKDACEARCCPCPTGGRCCRPPDRCCSDAPTRCCICPERRRCIARFQELPGFYPHCCEEGEYCCKDRFGKSCCPEGTPCDPALGCNGANFCPARGARGAEPCPAGRTSCCGPQGFSCCPDQETCCEGVCCPPGEECGPNKRCRIRCEPDRTRCDGSQGSSCCPPEQACCDGFCCPPGERCGPNLRCQRGA